ncbi:MAG TPA: hypothetical protein VNA57_05780 [Acidimicrobiales bacterium]|nr:hypothetical protein [Acidimicrobiales bacterium]
MTMSTTSTTPTTTPEAEAYLAAVRDELDDLPEEERADLLEDLALHLAELSYPDNRDVDAPPLHVRLGPPARYAAELRSAAGLPPRTTSPSAGTADNRRLRDAVAGSGAGRLVTAAWRHPWALQARSFLPQLSPAWWVLRGYLVVALPTLWSSDGIDDFPVPTVLGSKVVGAAAVLGAVVASVHLANRRLGPRARLAVRAGDAVLVLAGLALLFQAESRLSVNHAHFESSPQTMNFELSSPHGPVTNIFPYGRDGTPLEDVLLFDQDGRPLRTATQEWWPDGCRRSVAFSPAADGVAVEFSYPKRYTVVDGHPTSPCVPTPARPPVPIPQFAPPPTPSEQRGAVPQPEQPGPVPQPEQPGVVTQPPPGPVPPSQR